MRVEGRRGRCVLLVGTRHSTLVTRIAQRFGGDFQHQLLLRQHVLHFERRDAELAQRHPDFLDAAAQRNVGPVWNLPVFVFRHR